jgi:serine/threonine protein kinase
VEAKAASSLNHPNIIKIYEYAVSEFGLPYMVMDFVEGESLADRYR